MVLGHAPEGVAEIPAVVVVVAEAVELVVAAAAVAGDTVAAGRARPAAVVADVVAGEAEAEEGSASDGVVEEEGTCEP